MTLCSVYFIPVQIRILNPQITQISADYFIFNL